MLALYFICLAIGLVLIVVSYLSGGDSSEGEVGSGHTDGGDAAEGGEGELHGFGWASVLPLVSLSFWTFFLAFFGLTGAVLAAFTGASVGLTALVAVGVGYVSGLSVTQVVRKLRRHEVGSGVRAQDYLGEVATVVLPTQKGQLGKVRLTVRGRTVDLLAEGDSEVALGPHEQVVVHEVLDDGSVRVTKLVEPKSKGEDR